ncbi:MAG TPA: hypothetical protein VF407_04035 [Polyangiaceae bacterium]
MGTFNAFDGVEARGTYKTEAALSKAETKTAAISRFEAIFGLCGRRVCRSQRGWGGGAG